MPAEQIEAFYLAPASARVPIMQAKQVQEKNCRFQNRELAERWKQSSTFDYVLLGSASLLIVMMALTGALVYFTGVILPSAGLFGIVMSVIVLAMFLGPLILRQRRKRLYTEASSLVCRIEPSMQLLQLIGGRCGSASAYDGYGYGSSWETEPSELLISNLDGSGLRRFRLGASLANNRVGRDNPFLYDRTTVAEVYLHPETQLPLGMFSRDRVYWFI